MKERELREHATCALCGNKIGHTGVPLFWRVTIERFGLDGQALQRQQGLGMMLGGHGLLAQVMGPDEDLAERILEVKLAVCEHCATMEARPIAALAELS